MLRNGRLVDPEELGDPLLLAQAPEIVKLQAFPLVGGGVNA